MTGDYVVDEYGFDPEVTQRFMMAALRPIAEKWFRIEVRGAENIPAEGGALVVSNHSGTVPVDGLMTMVSIHDATGRQLRPLGADLVFRMPFVSTLARKGGATLACNEDAERMLAGGELVGVWPEGFKGIGKPYADRYKLQRFGRGGFVSAALRTGVPIVPLSVVGAEEIYPLVGNIPSLARLLGVPYIPITPFFPLLGPLGLVPLPSKWLLEFGEPIRTDEYERRRGRRPDAGLQRDRPGARDDPADALLAADAAAVGLPLADGCGAVSRRAVEQRVGEVVERRPRRSSTTVGRPGSGRRRRVVRRSGVESPPIRPFARSPSGLLGWFGVCRGRCPCRTPVPEPELVSGSGRCPAAASRGRCPGRRRPACRRRCRCRRPALRAVTGRAGAAEGRRSVGQDRSGAR